MGIGLMSKNRFYGWVVVGAASSVLFFVNGVYLYSFGAFLPSICKEFGWGSGDVSIALMILMVVTQLIAPIAGFFIGKFGPRMAIIVGNVFGVAALLALSFHNQLWQFRVAYGLVGVASGLTGILTTSTLCSNWFRKKTPLAMGLTVTAGGIGGMVMTPLIMNTIIHQGWRTAYLCMCILMAVAAAVNALLLRNKPADLGQFPDGVEMAVVSNEVSSPIPQGNQYRTSVDFTLAQTLKTPAFWFLTIFGNTAIFLTTLVTGHQIAFLTQIGISPEVAATTLGLASFDSAAGTMLIGFLSMKYGIKPLAICTSSATVLSMIMAFFTTNTFMAFAYSIVFGIGFGSGIVVAMSLMSAYFGPTHFPKIMGVNMLTGLVGSIGAPVAGYLYDFTGSYRVPFLVAIAVALLGFLCMVLIRPPVHPSLKRSAGVNLEGSLSVP